MSARTLVIAGASCAGVQLAASAREMGFDGPIVMVGDEPHLPYQRPPLSKGVLNGRTAVDQIGLRGPAFYDEQRIELLLGRRAVALDVAARRVTLDDGSALAYDHLAITTGARARVLALPGAALDGVLSLRSLDDALRIAGELGRVRRVCVIGGGFIGLETASALTARGIHVTVVETQTRLLPRSFTPRLSKYIADVHWHRGVNVLCGRGVRAFLGTSRVEAVELDDGHRVECDLVVTGIGVIPNTEWARAAGLPGDRDGALLVDTRGHTPVPGVLAAGDCVAMPSPFTARPGRPVRLESIQAANDGARAAAATLVGRDAPCVAVPWFWSEQHDLKLQMTGLGEASDTLVLRGRPDDHRFTAFHLRDGRVAAAHSVNRPAEHLLSRKLVAAGVAIDAERLADESFDLKSTLAPV
ncbi:NAD(P)/FAD-dependent oxidoreductase [Piscinibacter gummiphilus]|uniref:Pyridine nucleotide-disulfide oxidoreductase n=1 Tax=Piscinibacter gummiphilus TaxID=946333 RepID=A0A1W6L357_9BURK|nr:FAD-dependent oxidoreductase [Piscinibacter gummiphilus]ARN18725.1 pyridine nucleotide-disulfide oxidoreductase [Piscinibacter gummiphilus]GLS95877.1 pyridine nucleotide-disulfide oxidoreductase [Piscinibacter gummiphilus]